MAERLDRREFIDLLKRMLTLDQERRITPADANDHGFIKMIHLMDYAHCNVYVWRDVWRWLSAYVLGFVDKHVHVHTHVHVHVHVHVDVLSQMRHELNSI